MAECATAGKPENDDETEAWEAEKQQTTPDQPTPVEVTITVPGPYTVIAKGGASSLREAGDEALRILARAAQLVHRDERTGQLL